ncbi:hypothetical protein SJPD1_1668 [Sulfurospirillum diekertiae]|uniref:DinB-like domain-containing protein n=1 Tax=Sulfurospirillum diekertiae TaxID=1854492 RepID=A0A290HE16_9BACT|nr:hypothetical protein [Sulfurospirillum diekertiae]ATB69773.1 hypothetical protein SJPD1_1668 [Sulfurospirillum diekertiae]
MELLENVSNDIRRLLGELDTILRNVDINKVATKTTIRQIVGHMCDSASNNTHRIIHLQYQKSPLIFPDYANLGVNDIWIKIQNYNTYEWDDLIHLLKYTTIHVAHVIQNIDSTKLQQQWISALNEHITLEEMIVDYPRHFKLHYDEIVDLIAQ